MSEANLLAFGCVVTFIGATGAYVYLRECFTTAREDRAAPSVRGPEVVEDELSEVA